MNLEDILPYRDLVLRLLRPLLRAVDSPKNAEALLRDLGYAPPGDVTAFQDFSATVDAIRGLISEVEDAVDGSHSSAALGALIRLLPAVGGFLKGLNNLQASIQGNFAGSSFLAQTDILAVIAKKLTDYVIVRFLEDNYSTVFATLALAGVVELEDVNDVPTQFNVPYRKRTVNWDKISAFATDPLTTLKSNFVGVDEVLTYRLMYFLGLLGNSLGLPAALGTPDDAALTTFNRGTDITVRDDYDQLSILRIPLLTDPAASLAVEIYPILDVTTGKHTGLGAGLHFGQELQIPLTDSYQMVIKFSSNLADSLGFRVDRDGNLSFINRIFAPNPEELASAIQFNATVSLVPTDTGPQDPLVTIGTPQGTRLQIGSGALELGLVKTDSFRMYLEVEIKNVQIAFATGEADSFLSSLLPKDGTQTNFDFGVGFSNQRGLYFKGASNFKVRLPLHLTLGPIEIQYLQIEFGVANNSFPLTLSTGFSAVLGPLAVAVDEIGVKATFATLADRTGNFGPLDVGFGFKFPSGLGISIDAGPVAGGGFISFDDVKKEYAGFLDICIAEIIQVKFIAILDTELPDGSNGYSFIFIIFLELPPIQLGYGFTLNGVGGVAGINRTMVTTALQAGVYNHTLECVINPPHTVADAPKVISAISNFFPPALGRYVFGPIVAIGWETFIQLTVGVILEVPDPIRLALLGIVDVALPSIEDPDEAIVLLHILVLGTLDFGTKKLAIDGSMYGSRILEFPILGDFALRTSWGANPSSLFSMGGLNPHFNTSGLDVPQLHRMAISISDGDNPQISANSYLALTSNTIQFGADIEAHVSKGDFKVHGYLGFDVLIFIAPPTISFEFDFAAGFDVSYKGHNLAGVTLTGTLTGTTPWHIHGDATLHLLCFSVSKSVDKTWGDTITPQPPPEAILPDLLPALADPRNWSAALPDGTTQAATLNTPKSDPKTVIVHPMGTLTVREKVIPLDLQISHYKSGIPSDGNYFSIGDVLVNGVKVSKDAFQDFFAAGQFIDLSDADKLSRSSFQPYDAGVKLASTNICSGADSPRTVAYDEHYIDDPISPPRPPSIYQMPANVYVGLCRQSAGFQSFLKSTGFNKYRTGPSTPAATTKDPSYVVTSVDDLSVRTDITEAKGMTYYQARTALDSHLARNPQDAGNLQILPAHEAAP